MTFEQMHKKIKDLEKDKKNRLVLKSWSKTKENSPKHSFSYEYTTQQKEKGTINLEFEKEGDKVVLVEVDTDFDNVKLVSNKDKLRLSEKFAGWFFSQFK